MLYTNFTEELLEMQDVNVTKIEKTDEILNVYLELNVQEHTCPCCGAKTTTIHDYRVQKIKDIPNFMRATYIYLRKRRYRCNDCGKRFYENNSFLPRYHRMTNRLAAYIIESLRNVSSFTSVAKAVNVSITTVIRVFDLVSYPKPELPAVLSIDEFKGNTGGHKYQCIITDPDSHVVLDILPQRYSHYLTDYFKKLNRDDVKFFVSDMWDVYRVFADNFLRNATQIIDKYHYIRQIVWAFENVRKEEQKKFSKSHRIYFKRSKSLLIKHYDKLSDDEKSQVNVMLYASVRLSNAYDLKESFFKLLKSKNGDEAKKLLLEWIDDAGSSGINHFEKCARTLQNWFIGIKNSFDFSYTNGFTEGCNNKIKVLKRNAYGYRNFKRFRNRILHMFSHQKLSKKLTVVA